MREKVIDLIVEYSNQIAELGCAQTNVVENRGRIAVLSDVIKDMHELVKSERMPINQNGPHIRSFTESSCKAAKMADCLPAAARATVDEVMR